MNRLEEFEKKLNSLVEEFKVFKENCKLSKPEIGETIKVADIEWTVLDKVPDGYLCITKDIIETMKFGADNNWETSSLREYLNGEFYKKIISYVGENGIKEMFRDLVSMDGQTEYGCCSDKISIASLDEYRKYRMYLPNLSKLWWLLTPHTTPCNGSPNYVQVINSDGCVYFYWHHYKHGVRPFLIFSSSIFES